MHAQCSRLLRQYHRQQRHTETRRGECEQRVLNRDHRTGAKIDIAFAGNDTVASLILGGTNVGPGTCGTDYVIQTSSDLNTWAPVVVGEVTIDNTAPGKSVSYTLTGAGKRFVRLLVNPN